MAQAEIESKLDNTGMGISWSGAYETNYLYGKESWAYNESKMNSWDVTLTERKQYNPSSEISVLHSEP